MIRLALVFRKHSFLYGSPFWCYKPQPWITRLSVTCIVSRSHVLLPLPQLLPSTGIDIKTTVTPKSFFFSQSSQSSFSGFFWLSPILPCQTGEASSSFQRVSCHVLDVFQEHFLLSITWQGLFMTILYSSGGNHQPP